MRKLRRSVLRHEADRQHRRGYGKRIHIFHALWDDYKELGRHKALEAAEGGILEQIRRMRRQREKKKADEKRRTKTLPRLSGA